jgi:hypothetical protein
MKEFVIGSLTGIVGVVVGIYFSYLIGIKLQREWMKREAFSDFYSTFIETIYYLEGAREDLFEAIPNFLPEHERAKILFYPYLRTCNIKRFDIAWKEYYDECRKYYQPPKSPLMEDEKKRCQGELLSKIKVLIDVAKE